MHRNAQPIASTGEGVETNTFPLSITIVSGTITGRAAASSIRASMSTSRAWGSRDADIRNAVDRAICAIQPYVGRDKDGTEACDACDDRGNDLDWLRGDRAATGVCGEPAGVGRGHSGRHQAQGCARVHR
jgi:hypothetical protein